MRKNVFALSAIFLASLVSAGPVQGAQQLLSGLGQIVVAITQFSLNTILNINSIDQFLFAKIIFFILIFLVIYVVIDRNDFFGDNKAIKRIITAAIAILSVRFIPDQLVRVIFLQYGALGVTLGVIMPFLMILFFLHQSNFGPLPRKVSWILYGISYGSVFYYSYQSLSEISSYIYWAGIIGIVASYLFDRQIHAEFGSMELQKARRRGNAQRYADIQERIDKISKQLMNSDLVPVVRSGLEKSKRDLEKMLSKIMKDL